MLISGSKRVSLLLLIFCKQSWKPM